MTRSFTRLCHPNDIVHDIWSANFLSTEGPVTTSGALFSVVPLDSRVTEERASGLHRNHESSVKHYIVCSSSTTKGQLMKISGGEGWSGGLGK